MTLVIDASVAVKWVVEETGTCEATTLLESQEPLVAPELVVAEMANVLWRLHRQGAVQQEQVTLLLTQGLGAFWELASLSTLAARATSIALELAHPAYDCFYLALADLHKTVLVTADSRLLQRVAGTPWEARARLLTA